MGAHIGALGNDFEPPAPCEGLELNFSHIFGIYWLILNTNHSVGLDLGALGYDVRFLGRGKYDIPTKFIIAENK